MAGTDASQDDRESARPVRVREAAARLNLSPVQVRRLIQAGWLRAVKDNRGHWLVHLPEKGSDVRQLSDDAREEVDAILTKILMDDLSYLEDRSDDQDEQIARMRDLLARQADLLSQAIDAAEKAAADRDAARRENRDLAAAAARATALLEEAVAQAEAGAARAAALEATTGHATDLVQRAVLQAEAAQDRANRLEALVARSLALLDRWTGPDSTGRPAFAKLDGMIARALDAAEAAETARDQSDQRLRTREAQLDRLAEMVERSLESKAGAASAPRRRRWPFSVLPRR